MSDFTEQDLPDGTVGPYDRNEVAIVSSINDPPKLRLAVRVDQVESNIGGLSGNIARADGRQEEFGLIRFRLAPNRTDGALEIMLAEVDATGVIHERTILYLDPKGILSYVPITVEGGISAGSAPNELRAPGGVFWCVIQATDGNFVCYRNRVPFDYSTGVPYFSSGPAPAL